MTRLVQLQSALDARSVTPDDLSDIVEALLRDLLRGTMAEEPLEQAVYLWGEAMRDEGLLSQLEFMLSYYGGQTEYLEWALTGFLTLPCAA